MKDTLKRLFGVTQAATAEVVEPTEGTEMATELNKVEADKAAAMALDLDGLRTAVAAMTEQLAANATELSAKDDKIAELSALVAAATEFKAAQEKIAAEAKVAARVSKLANVVGDEQAASLQAATAALDDAAFDAVVSAMTSKATTEAASPAFKEVGVEGAADAQKLAAEGSGSRVMDYLKTVTHDVVHKT